MVGTQQGEVFWDVAPLEARLKNLARTAWISLMVGGWTILLAAILAVVEWQIPPMQRTWMHGGQDLAPLFATLAIAINYPHAVWGYRLAFGQGPKFIWQNWDVLLLLPATIILGFIAVVNCRTLLPSEMEFLMAADRFLGNLGVFTNYAVYPSVGDFLLATLLVCQMVFSGQHYVMQSYGISLHGARAGGYRLDDDQRRWMRWNMQALWAINICSGYSFLQTTYNAGFVYYPPRLPEAVVWGARFAFALTSVWVLYAVVVRNWLNYRRLPPAPAWCAYLSGVIWMQPFWYPLFGYNIWIVPLAHCVQYLFFVYGVERVGFPTQAKALNSGRRWLQFSAITLVLVAMGYVGFEYGPVVLDAKYSFSRLPSTYFILCAFVLINVQHYFIDGIVWRNEKSVVRSVLPKIFSAAKKGGPVIVAS